MPKRTASFDVDKTFDVHCEITKSRTLPNGRRVIRGVATGVLEDRDGERVSKRAIAEMAMTPTRGLKLVADLAGHEQTFISEIGDVTKMVLDPETDELIVEAELPPEGEDPIADKCWKALASGQRLGYSIGGKLRSAYHELAERGGRVVKRKVLDSIGLKHVLLTARPAYSQSFVETVAKTASGIVLDDSVAFDVDEDADTELQDALQIAKAAKPDETDEPATPEQGSQDGDAPAPGEPAPDQAPAPAAEGEQAPAAQPTDAQAAEQLPMAKRHLSCPNCGEEFAADLPANEPTDTPTSNDNADTPDTGKTAKESNAMDPKETLAAIRALADGAGGADVEKTTPESVAPAPAAAEVAKATTAEPSELERMLAAAYQHSETRFADIEKHSRDGFDVVAKALQGLAEQVASMPLGRKSLAAVRDKPQVEVGKTATDTDNVAKAVEDAPDAISALRAMNAARGIV